MQTKPHIQNDINASFYQLAIKVDEECNICIVCELDKNCASFRSAMH